MRDRSGRSLWHEVRVRFRVRVRVGGAPTLAPTLALTLTLALTCAARSSRGTAPSGTRRAPTCSPRRRAPRSARGRAHRWRQRGDAELRSRVGSSVTPNLGVGRDRLWALRLAGSAPLTSCAGERAVGRGGSGTGRRSWARATCTHGSWAPRLTTQTRRASLVDGGDGGDQPPSRHVLHRENRVRLVKFARVYMTYAEC